MYLIGYKLPKSYIKSCSIESHYGKRYPLKVWKPLELHIYSYTVQIKKKIRRMLLLQKTSSIQIKLSKARNYTPKRRIIKKEFKIHKSNGENEVSAQTRPVRRPAHTSLTQRSLGVQFVWLTSGVRLQRLKDCNDAIASNRAWKFRLYLFLWMLWRFHICGFV